MEQKPERTPYDDDQVFFEKAAARKEGRQEGYRRALADQANHDAPCCHMYDETGQPVVPQKALPTDDEIWLGWFAEAKGPKEALLTPKAIGDIIEAHWDEHGYSDAANALALAQNANTTAFLEAKHQRLVLAAQAVSRTMGSIGSMHELREALKEAKNDSSNWQGRRCD